MTIHVSIGEAEKRLSELVAAAVRGEDVILDQKGAPQVRLVMVANAGSTPLVSPSGGARRSACIVIASKAAISTSSPSSPKSAGTNITDASLPIPIDTQALVWVGTGSSRLSEAARTVIVSDEAELFVSAVTAFEYADFNLRGRFGADLPLARYSRILEAVVLDFPAAAWPLIETLPDLHRDPVDRMLIAHALHADLTIVTADATVRAYPVNTLS